MLSFITTLLLLLLSGELLAQEYPRMERLTTEQGLSQNIVYSIFQDRQGFLWFGTRDGLSRYDGYRFMVFRHDPFDSTSLPYASVESITADAEGNIWLICAGGVCRLDRRTYHFSRVTGALGSSVVFALQGDRWGNMWIGTEHGLMRYDTRARTIERFCADPGDPFRLYGDSVVALYEDRAGMLWIGTDGGYVHRYDPASRKFARFDPGVRAAVMILRINEDSRGTIHALVRRDSVDPVVVLFDRASGAVVRRIFIPGKGFPVRMNWVEAECIDSSGGLWISVLPWERTRLDNGRAALRRMPLYGGDGEMTFRTPGERPIGWKIWTMLCDRSGIIWIGTSTGVVKMILDEPRFRSYRNIPEDPASLSDSRVRGIHKDRHGTLWVGTDEGLNRLDTGSRGWVRYIYDWAYPGRHGGVVANTIFEDADGRLFIGTNNGFFVYDRTTNTFSNGRAKEHPQFLVWSFCRDSSGMLWVGTRDDGIFLYDRAGHRVRQFIPHPNDATTIAPGIVWDMHRDRYGTLWIATGSGLYRWLPERGIFRRYGVRPADPHGLSGENVCAIMEDPSGGLWFSTYGGGLNRYNRSTDDFAPIMMRNGLPSNTLYGTLMDARGNLWISSNAGLTSYDTATGICRTYTAGDGLQSNEFSFKAFHKTSDGEMIFGGANGLSMFHPDSLHTGLEKAPIVVTEFRVFNEIARREILDSSTVEIGYDENFISFEFALLDYANPAGIRYAYRLEGANEDWIDCGERRHADFMNLDPGTYTFMVKVSGSNGPQGPRPLRIVLKVIPPFWMTWWFRGLALAGIILGTIGGMLLWIRSSRGREILRRRSVESQLQALRLQINPHFIFNALSSIQHLILVAQRERAVEYLSRFARLVRSVLENSERTYIPLADEIANLHNYLHLEMFRFEGRFQYAIDIDPKLDIHHVSIPTMLIQPYVENAIRHGLYHKWGEGGLRITISGRGGSIHCSIEDDGVGRKRAGELRGMSGHGGRSMGIRVTEERLNILNAAAMKGEPISMAITDLCDAQGAPAGTRVDLSIPAEFL